MFKQQQRATPIFGVNSGSYQLESTGHMTGSNLKNTSCSLKELLWVLHSEGDWLNLCWQWPGRTPWWVRGDKMKNKGWIERQILGIVCGLGLCCTGNLHGPARPGLELEDRGFLEMARVSWGSWVFCNKGQVMEWEQQKAFFLFEIFEQIETTDFIYYFLFFLRNMSV